jgi:hypothetical protein
MCGLLVNLLEKCSNNRRKFLNLKALFYDAETKDSMEMSADEAITKVVVVDVGSFYASGQY